MLEFVFSSERKNYTHFSRICPLSRSSLPFSSLTYCFSTFFVSSSCMHLIFWTLLVLARNSLSNSMTWRSKKRTAVALHTLLRHLHERLTALRSCTSLEFIFRRWQSVCIASVAACSLAFVWVSTLQPRPGLLHPLGPHDGRGECSFHVVHTTISWRVCPEVPSNRDDHHLSKLWISHRVPTINWWLSWGPQPVVTKKMLRWASRRRTQCGGSKLEGRRTQGEL